MVTNVANGVKHRGFRPWGRAQACYNSDGQNPGRGSASNISELRQPHGGVWKALKRFSHPILSKNPWRKALIMWGFSLYLLLEMVGAYLWY